MAKILAPTAADHVWRGGATSHETGSDTHHLYAIEDAIWLLNTKATQLASGSTAIWRIVDHARRHLERQMEAAIR